MSYERSVRLWKNWGRIKCWEAEWDFRIIRSQVAQHSCLKGEDIWSQEKLSKLYQFTLLQCSSKMGNGDSWLLITDHIPPLPQLVIVPSSWSASFLRSFSTSLKWSYKAKWKTKPEPSLGFSLCFSFVALNLPPWCGYPISTNATLISAPLGQPMRSQKLFLLIGYKENRLHLPMARTGLSD